MRTLGDGVSETLGTEPQVRFVRSNTEVLGASIGLHLRHSADLDIGGEYDTHVFIEERR
jgi:hypothetical protein